MSNLDILTYASYTDLPQLGTYGVAYVRDEDAYYLFYPMTDSWEPLQSPSIETDRLTHLVNTQGVNGYNLDYYPDYSSVRQKPYNINELGLIFGAPGLKNNSEVDWHPGDLILRSQEWTVEAVSQRLVPEGLLLTVNMPDGDEITDKWVSSRNIPMQTDAYAQFQTGTVLYDATTDTEYPVLEHWPNGRRARYDDPEPTSSAKLDRFWSYSNQPTTEILLRATAPIDLSYVALYHEATYIVTCECLDHGELATAERGEGALGHRRKCFQCYRLTSGIETRIRRFLTDMPGMDGDISYHRDDLTGSPQWRYQLGMFDPLIPQLYTAYTRADVDRNTLPHGYLFVYCEQAYTLPRLTVASNGEITRSPWSVPLYAGRLYMCGGQENE